MSLWRGSSLCGESERIYSPKQCSLLRAVGQYMRGACDRGVLVIIRSSQETSSRCLSAYMALAMRRDVLEALEVAEANELVAYVW